MTVINPYLTFQGNCEEAFNYYKQVFGGEFSFMGRFSEMPPQEGVTLSEEDADKIMHISLPINKENILMGSDSGGEWAPGLTVGNNISLSITAESKEDADRFFNMLSDGGKVTMPMDQTFWGDYFGMCTDKFGINWMISLGESKDSAVQDMEQLQAKASIQILKPIGEVFEAIVDPGRMTNYFISKSTGRMEQGKTLVWEFPEFPDSFAVEVTEVRSPDYVSFLWEGAAGKKLLVEISLQQMENDSTLVKVTEGKLENDPAGIAWFGGNTEGWANFLACLKAYLEYGINLRKGAFDFMRPAT